jgi:hypothetical protein
MAKANLSPELERKYAHALTETIDKVDNLRADLKEITKERKGEIATHEKAVFRLRRLLSGKEVEQLEVPGAELPSVAPRKDLEKAVAQAKRTKDEVLEDIHAELDRRKGTKAGAIQWIDGSDKPGLDGRSCAAEVPGGNYALERHPAGWFNAIWLPAGGKRVQLITNVQKETAKRTCEQHFANGRPEKKAAPLAGLAWKASGRNDVADVKGGCYCLEPSLNPSAPAFTIFWTPDGGNSKRIGVAKNVAAALDLADADWLERGADALLKNAGAGELTKADTKGPAVARKKGGRRG